MLVGLTGSSRDLDDVESNSLGDWSTLTNGNNVTNLDTESWGDVDWDVLVSLFVSVVLWNVLALELPQLYHVVKELSNKR